MQGFPGQYIPMPQGSLTKEFLPSISFKPTLLSLKPLHFVLQTPYRRTNLKKPLFACMEDIPHITA